MVVAPMLLAIMYYGFFAEDRYISTSEVVVHKVGSDSGGAASQMQGLAVLMSGSGLADSTSAETLYVREFIVSQDMLDILQKKLSWSEHYSGRMRDFWYYLSPTARQEDLLKYYQRMVKARFDESTGLLTVEVQGFDRNFTQQTLSAIISESDRFVNEISRKLAREQVGFAESELDKSRANYDEKRKALLIFQGEHNVLDAQKTAMARNEIIANLQGELTKEEATLIGMRASLSEDSPQIRQQKIRITALKQQISAEDQNLVAKNASNQLNVIASKYHALEVDAKIAEEAYKSSVSSLDAARIEATKKLRSLVVVVNPNMPDAALFPRRLYSLFTTLVVLLLIFGVTNFVVATIKDHRD